LRCGTTGLNHLSVRLQDVAKISNLNWSDWRTHYAPRAEKREPSARPSPKAAAAEGGRQSPSGPQNKIACAPVASKLLPGISRA